MGELQAKLENLVFCYCHVLSAIKPLLVRGEYVSRAWDSRYPCVSRWFPASPRSPRSLPRAQPFARGLCGLLSCRGLPILTTSGWPRSPTAPPDQPLLSPTHPLSLQLDGQTWEQAVFENISYSGPSKDCQLSARRNPSLPPQQISQGCAICRALG